jgi:hypothetical protein
LEYRLQAEYSLEALIRLVVFKGFGQSREAAKDL